MISTVHAAKGLEWPVVFVPCGEFELTPFTCALRLIPGFVCLAPVEEGIFPFYRCEGEKEIMEERSVPHTFVAAAASSSLTGLASVPHPVGYYTSL